MSLRSNYVLLLGLLLGSVGLAAMPAAADLGGLQLIDAQGGHFTQASSAPVTMVGLWATWCPSCRSELPELVALGKELKAKGVELVLVSVDRTPEKAARYLEAMTYTGTAAYDPGARSATRLGVEGIPTVLILDASGREQKRVVGSGKAALTRIRAEVAQLLDSQTAAAR